jgi:ethanolaminephosphotransferase
MINQNSDAYPHKKDDFQYRYLSPDAIQSLKNFRYNGVDHSLLYKHVLSPLAGYLVDNCTPSTVAPNSITLFGFSFMIGAFLLIFSHCPSLEYCSSAEVTSVPRYIFLVNAIALLVYQTLDNMDGKQARKTGSSSPLGLLFDHGLDACNVYIGTVNTLCALCVAPDEFAVIAIVSFCTASTFYIATWEEYHTHKLVLPIINGPSEGVLGSAMVSFLSWWYGPQMWLTSSAYEAMEAYIPVIAKDMASEWSMTLQDSMTNRNLFCMLLVVCTLRELVAKVWYVVAHYGVKSVKHLCPLLTLMTMSILIVRRNPQVFVQNQRMALTMFGIGFVESVTALMLDHMTKRPFDPFRRILYPMFLLYSVVDMGIPAKYISLYMVLCVSGMSSFLIVKIRVVVREICHALGIWCFDIVTPHPNRTDDNAKKMT